MKSELNTAQLTLQIFLSIIVWKVSMMSLNITEFPVLLNDVHGTVVSFFSFVLTLKHTFHESLAICNGLFCMACLPQGRKCTKVKLLACNKILQQHLVTMKMNSQHNQKATLFFKYILSDLTISYTS